MKKILCVVFIICLLMLSACSVTTEDKVKLFDEVCSSIDELFATDENGNHYTLPIHSNIVVLHIARGVKSGTSFLSFLLPFLRHRNIRKGVKIYAKNPYHKSRMSKRFH